MIRVQIWERISEETAAALAGRPLKNATGGGPGGAAVTVIQAALGRCMCPVPVPRPPSGQRQRISSAQLGAEPRPRPDWLPHSLSRPVVDKRKCPRLVRGAAYLVDGAVVDAEEVDVLESRSPILYYC